MSLIPIGWRLLTVSSMTEGAVKPRAPPMSSREGDEIIRGRAMYGTAAAERIPRHIRTGETAILLS